MAFWRVKKELDVITDIATGFTKRGAKRIQRQRISSDFEPSNNFLTKFWRQLHDWYYVTAFQLPRDNVVARNTALRVLSSRQLQFWEDVEGMAMFDRIS